MKTKILSLVATLLLSILPILGFTQVIDLSSASRFSVFTSAGAFNNDGITHINGDIGTNVGAFSGFPPGIVNGQIHLANVITAQAAASLNTAYGSLSAVTCGLVLSTTLGGGQTLSPNVYCLGAAATLNGTLTLNGQGNPNSVFIFKVDGALSTGTTANVVLTNSADICNVYWQINGAFYLGINSVFQGTVLAGGQITLDINSTLNGRVLTTAGAVILHSTTVNINPPTEASISANRSTDLCLGETVILSSSLGNTYLWSNGETTRSISVSTADNYSVTVSDACGVATSTPTSVTVNPNPVAAIAADGPLTFCQGGNVTLTASGGTSYLWSNGATTTSIVVSTSGSFSVIATNNAGCISTATAKQVIVNTNPAASISSNGPLTFCQGGSVILTASGGSSYLWSTGATTSSITVSTSGSYNVVATSAAGCKGTSATTMVTVNPNPTANISANGPTTFCQGGSVTLTASPGSSYLWSTAATTQSTTVSTSGNYTVRVTNANGCQTTSAATTVTVNPSSIPTITATGPLTFCAGGSVILSSSAASGYLWNTGATTQSITVTTAGSYSVTTTGTCAGTSASSVVTITPSAIPTITASGPITFCPGGSVILTSSGASGYVWSTGATTQSVTVTSSGSYTVTTSGTCAGTSAATVVTVSAGAIPTISANGPLTFCQGGSVILTSSSASGYLWSTGATTQSITVTTTGNYSVTTSGTCAGTSAATSVIVIPILIPTISANGPLIFCQGGSVILTSSSSSGYLWSTGATTQSITITISGTYSVTTTANCGGTSTPVTVTVSPTIIPTITANGPLTFCPSGNVILTSSVASGYLWSNGATTQSITVTTAGSYTVTTTGTCGGTSAPTNVTINPSTIPTISASGPLAFCPSGSVILTSSGATGYLWSTGATTQSITVTTAGNYTVTTTGACAGTSAVTVVTINPTAIPTITVNGPLTFCQGGSIILTASSASGYLWSTGAITQSINVTATGNYSVTTSGSCGGTSAIVAVTVFPLVVPTITANGPLSFCPAGSVTLTASSSSGYLWSTGATTQSITVSTAGNYSVTATGICGVTSATVILTINPLENPTISASGPLSFCPGDSVILTASAANGYLWSTGATTQSIIVKTAGNYTVTTSGLCSGTSAATTVIINPITIPTISVVGSTTFCEGDSILLTSSAGSGYIWSTGATTQIIVVKTAGTYTVTTAGFCGDTSASIAVQINPSNIPIITVSGLLLLCQGDSVILTSSMASKYIWSNRDTTRQIVVKTGGIYTVTTPGICAGISTSTIVTVNTPAIPVITASGRLNMCIGDSVILTSSQDSGHIWSTGDSTKSIIVKESGTYTVFIQGVCSDTSIPVIVNVNNIRKPTITADGPLSFCLGEDVILTASPGSSWWWSNKATTQSIRVTASRTYSVRVYNECGYNFSASIYVNVSPGPDCNIITKSPFCKIESTQLCATASNVKYQWSTGDTTQCITINKIGTYSVTTTNALGCSSVCSKTITESEYPDCTISVTPAICPLQDYILSAPTGVNLTYMWSTGATTEKIAVWKPGVYSLSVTNSNGCVSTCSTTVKEIAPLNCFIMGKTNLCTGESTELKGPMGAASYLWNNGDKGGWINVTKAGIYTLTITNAEGCTKVCSVTVTVEECIVCMQGNRGTLSTFINSTSRKENAGQIYKVPNNSEISPPDISIINVQAFPNPFINSTTIEFSNSVASEMVIVDVFNVQAQKIATLYQGILPKNEKHRVRFDATNLNEGIYYYRMTNGKYTITKKIVLLKN
jgi:hypothetical protein